MLDPDIPFLNSPLPQFTTPLTTSSNSSFTPVPPLPELPDDFEEVDDSADSETADSETEHEAATPTVVPQDLQLKRLSDGSDSALAHTSPYTCPWTVKVSAQADAFDASPASPSKSTTLSQSQQVQHASSSREGDPSFSTHSPLVRNLDRGVLLRTRLHDLLRDSAMSSSLPNMSANHFPPSFTNHETSSGRVSPLPPRPDSSNTIKTPLPSSSSSDTALPQTTGAGKKPLSGAAPSFNFTLRPGFSTASTQAKKLEEERRRKKREEKQNPRLAKSAANDMDREGHKSKQPSTSTSTSTQPSNTTTTQPGSNHTGKFES